MPRTSEAQAFLAAHGGTGLAPLAGAIGDVLQQKGRCVVGLDGMAAAGKTTAAALLCRAFGGAPCIWTIFSCRRPCARRSALPSPAGMCITSALPKRWRLHCALGRHFATACSIARAWRWRAREPCPPRRLLLLRALHSLHPFFSTGLYDVRAYYAISPEAQKARILARNGPAALCAFEGKWIPMENAYAAAFGIRESCGVLLQAQPCGAQGQHV